MSERVTASRIILNQDLQSRSYPWSLELILPSAWLAGIASEFSHVNNQVSIQTHSLSLKPNKVPTRSLLLPQSFFSLQWSQNPSSSIHLPQPPGLSHTCFCPKAHSAKLPVSDSIQHYTLRPVCSLVTQPYPSPSRPE